MDALDFVADSTRSGIRPLLANPAKSSSGKIVGQDLADASTGAVNVNY